MSVSELVAIVAKVTVKAKGKQLGTASGFFYLNGQALYFITNRHVIIDEKKNFIPDEITLRLHLNPSDLKQNGDLTIKLYENSEPVWREHPTQGKNVDVVAIPIKNEDINGKFFIKAFSSQNNIPDDIVLPLGQDVSVLGFPKGFHDEVYNLPIIRNATIASVYPVPFQDNPFILIDSRLHPGTSGSPVVTKPMNMVQKKDGNTAIISGSPIYFIGVHSASLDIKTGDEKEEPLGLNCAWFASLVEEITR